MAGCTRRENSTFTDNADDELPPPDTKRWIARRKAAVVSAVSSGAIGRDEARRRYQLSEEEFLTWERAIQSYGVPGLRSTRVQIYKHSQRLNRAEHPVSELKA
jgi:Protein of unknown function (DUF1153)